MSSCANCGKGEEESIGLKKCSGCKTVKYCNAACQKAHRPQHKKECRQHAAELHDEKLFKQPPNDEDCPICFLRMPLLETGRRYMSCCGKIVCCGCIYAFALIGGGDNCPFCRTLTPSSDEEVLEREKKRVVVDDAQAIHNRACHYAEGVRGLPQDRKKALELWHRAGGLGHSESYFDIGLCYLYGEGVEGDKKKAKHYWELGAIGGNAKARHSLGIEEVRAGNMKGALKHFLLAVEGGYAGSLKSIKHMYTCGDAKKDDYAKALQAYQAYLDDIRSEDRDKAAAFKDKEAKYYEL